MLCWKLVCVISTQKYLYVFFEVVKETASGEGPGRDHLSENAPERDRPDESGRGLLAGHDVLCRVTPFSSPSFPWTGTFVDALSYVKWSSSKKDQCQYWVKTWCEKHFLGSCLVLSVAAEQLYHPF